MKSALSSKKPHASASTADGVPILRRANIARYLSKSGSSGLSSFSLSDTIDASVTSAGFGCPDKRWEDGGAGSIEVYVLSYPYEHARKRRGTNARYGIRRRYSCKMVSPFFRVIPFDLCERDLARFAYAPIGIRKVLAQDRHG